AVDRPGSRLTLPVSLAVGVPVEVEPEGILNAATMRSTQTIAVNQLLSITGSNFIRAYLIPEQRHVTVASFPSPTRLGTTRVTFNGIAAPLVSVGPDRINLLVPSGLTGPTATMIVHRDTVSSRPITLPLAQQAIGV